jgi:hypothetical protein
MWIHPMDTRFYFRVFDKACACLGLLITTCAFVVSPASVNAAFLTGLYTNGTNNTLVDESREAWYDADGDNKISIGDVFIGFVKIGQVQPLGANTNNQVYGIFSQQVQTIYNVTGGPTHPSLTGVVIQFQATTVSGLRLKDIDGSINSGAMVAVYDKIAPFSVDLTSGSPGDVTGNSATNLFDYLKYITSNGNLYATAGIVNSDDFFYATPVGGVLGPFSGSSDPDNLGTGVNIAGFGAGLTILQNLDPVVIYNEAVVTNASGTFTTHELVVASGVVTGGNNLANYNQWSVIATEGSFVMGSGQNPGGFADKANFIVNVTVIPEPGTFALMGSILSVLGVGYATRRRQGA